MQFAKYSGCGNDFILIDNRKRLFAASKAEISRLCHRQQGIGADGIVLLEDSSSSDFGTRIFNADGSEAEMCGNGIRCLARFICDIEFSDKLENRFSIQTMHQRMHVRIEPGIVYVEMPPATAWRSDIAIDIGDTSFFLHSIDTGVPHAIQFVPDIENVFIRLAPEIRYHSEFGSRGTNVNFAQFLPDGTIAVRTYERGVEGETLACGTGAVAVALTAARIHRINSPIVVRPRSGDLLQISFNENFEQITLAGPAFKVFEGRVV